MSEDDAFREPLLPLFEGQEFVATDPKGRRHSLLLRDGATFHTSRGGIDHDALIGGPLAKSLELPRDAARDRATAMLEASFAEHQTA